MKTSTWVTLASIIVSAALIMVMLGLVTIPTKEQTAPETSVETSVSTVSSGSARQQTAPANVKDHTTPAEDLNEDGEQTAPAEDLNEDGEQTAPAEDLNEDGEQTEKLNKGE